MKRIAPFVWILVAACAPTRDEAPEPDAGRPEKIVTCDAGFENVGGTCRDVDGCSGSPCFAGVSCVDQAAPLAGHECGACPEGTTGDGTTCVDVDACADLPCFPGVACTDLPAPSDGFTCGACPSGLSGDGINCEEVDGCSGSPCFPGVSCTDVAAPGTGFTCGACPEGSEDVHGDGTSCVDRDECALGSDACDPLVTCTNTTGSYACGACPAGYDDPNGNGTACVDRDECALGLDACDPAAPCLNTPGGVHCGACPSGYLDVRGDGTLCTDWNECAGEHGGATCAGAGRCINTSGAYRCTCPDAADSDAVDLDANGVSDCVETLVQNSQFTTDLAHWTVTFNVARDSAAAQFRPTNREGSSATQCVPAAPSTTYGWWLQLRRDPANGGQYGGYGGLTLSSFATSDCSGGNESAGATSTWPEVSWMTLSGEFTTTPTTGSVLLTLTSSTPYTRNTVLMDDVLLRRK